MMIIYMMLVYLNMIFPNIIYFPGGIFTNVYWTHPQLNNNFWYSRRRSVKWTPGADAAEQQD